MDRSHAPQSSEADDDIIDLTDIVEQGSVPVASGDAGSGENPLESQMADLLTGTGKVPGADEDAFDLDALLKASGLNEDGGAAAPEGPAASDSPAEGNAAPADEELDMPDMGEVDALLRDLVAPEQPGPRSSDPDAVSSDPAPEEASAAHFSALLQENVVAEVTTVSPPTAPASAEPEVDVDDLDSLLDSIMNPEPAAGPVPPVPADEPPAGGPRAENAEDAKDAKDAEEAEDDADLADLDALLAAASGGGAVESVSVAPRNSVENAPEPGSPVVDMSPPPAPPAPEFSADAGRPGREEAPAAGKSPAVPDDEVDLDALLSEARAEMAREPAVPAAPQAPLPDSAPDAGMEPAAGTGRTGEDGLEKEEGENGENGEDGEDPLSGLDDLFAAAETADGDSAGTDLPLESDLGDPLLVGETDRADPDLGAMVLSSLDALAADIAAMQEKINAVAEGGGPDAGVFDALRDRVDDVTAEVRELAERHASGLAGAEARISALEAELAAQGAREAPPLVLPPEGSAFRADLAALIREAVARELREGGHVPPYAKSMSEDIARMEKRLDAVETAGEKAAAAAAARVIREEIAALAAEMGSEG